MPETCTASPLFRLIQIQGTEYVWTPGEGLEPEAVQEVDLFIWQQANRLRIPALKAGVSLDDLVQEGRLGALRAAQKYDPGKGANFLTYASWWIRQRMLEALSNGDVSIPDRKWEAMRKEGTFLSVASLDAPTGVGNSTFGDSLGGDDTTALDADQSQYCRYSY